MTRVYAAGPDGRCIVCQRPEAEHEPQAWSETPRACPPTPLLCDNCKHPVSDDHDYAGACPDVRACEKCGSTKDCHHKMSIGGTDIDDPAYDRDEAAHTLATAQAEIARFHALVVEWRAASRAVARIERSTGKPTASEPTTAALERLDASERALAESVAP